MAAIEFAAYFVEVLNYASGSGDTAVLDRLAAPSCESCANIQQATERVYAADGYVKGGEWSIKSQSVFQPSKDRQRRIVTFEVRTSEQFYRPSADEPEQHFAADESSVDIYVRPQGDSWVVTRMEKST